MTLVVQGLTDLPIHRLQDFVGFIPMWLDTNDLRPAAVQLNEHYQHGGGWRPFTGFQLVRENCLKYPGDPMHRPLAKIEFREEEIYIYEHAWVMIKQPNGSYEVCRMD